MYFLCCFNSDLSGMDKPVYTLDRSAFEALSFEDADRKMNRLEGLSWDENVCQFNYLMSVVFGFLGKEWPRMDKTYFEKIKRA